VGVSGRPRSILYVTTGLGVGGAEAMLARLATAQPGLADRITIVSLLPAEAHLEELRAAGIEVIELGFDTAVGALAGVYRLARLIAGRRPEVVQGWMYHGDLAALIALLLSGRRRHTPLIWSVRCSDVDLRLFSLQLRLVVKACTALSRFPDVITTNSAAGLKAHVRLGYRPRRVEVIANGIDVEQFKPDAAARAAVRAELGIPGEAFVAAHVARIDPLKGHDTFLAAMAALPQVRALLIGAGTENLSATPNVSSLGRRHDVARLLAAADIIVSSSVSEGFSNVLGEGMACGLPAVATDVGDAALIVGDAGVVVPASDPQALADAIRQLANEEPAARAARSLGARNRIVESFGIRRAIERYAQLYASLAGSRDFAKDAITCDELKKQPENDVIPAEGGRTISGGPRAGTR
jgi:glycosyltransferase involved in cell wall biosynthesis